ncbi:Sushi, nidogen and EGF-like domain-containing protein 1, partial [Geodia barretti]
EIRYRQTDDPALLSQARADVREVYPTFTAFNPTRLLIATWDQVAHFDSVVAFSGLTNTFQCVLITDSSLSFVIFLYADDLIQWSVGTANLSAHAQAGFNAGDGIRFTTIEGSRTEAIVNIETTSNIGVPGKYLFRVD